MKAKAYLALVAIVSALVGGCGGGNDAVTTTPTAHLAITLPVGPASVGTPYAVTVRALDASNAVVTTYAGTVHITTSDSSARLPPDATLSQGAGTFAVTFGASNTSQTVTAGDTAGNAKPVTSAPLSVTAPWSWTWVGGANTSSAQGVYGTQGVAAAGNVPGAREHSVSWFDGAGNLWLFGGYGLDAVGSEGNLNDLWRYNPVSGLWTWVSGSSITNAQGVYGAKGVAAVGNVPGARNGSVSWIDSVGNLWLFGGICDSAVNAQPNRCNDMWRFSPGSGFWTWVSGSNVTNAPVVYGAKGIAASGNVPGARDGSASWIDSTGNLWLFGGDGIKFDPDSRLGELNDLWRYSPGSGLWAWVGGANTVDAPGVYGSQGVAASGNVPGARGYPASWIDIAGNFWLFGGYGTNDMWRYSPDSGLWTWMSPNTTNDVGAYGMQGVAAAGNLPHRRGESVFWVDSAGNLWLFGGYGGRFYNDLWQYSPNGGWWAWVSGTNATDSQGVYGTQGVAAAGNVPGARVGSVSWIDGAGNLWLFGGFGYDSHPRNLNDFNHLNDLWRYSPGTGR